MARAAGASLPGGTLGDSLRPKQEITVTARDPANPNAAPKVFTTICRIDTPVEVEYYRNGGILPTVLRKPGKG
jgi:aconitate hydratase